MNPEKYNPDISWCLPDKKHFWSRAGLRLSRTSANLELVIKANHLYLLAIKYIDPVIYHLTAPAGFFPARLIPASFENIKSLTVFASTLGQRLDRLINDLGEKNHALEVLLLEAWGSESLETLNRSFDCYLRKNFGPGTRRFSPGYGSVEIRMNSFLVRQLLRIPESEIEVLESGVMLPRKTTTCLIGWYHEQK